jgi:hypothetical protein
MCYVLTTGTGSGKSLAYIVPIVDAVLRSGARDKRVKAIVVYPMNALANSQAGELEKFLCHGYPDGRPPVTFRRYTGQETDEQRQAIIADPPDILLTNYVMLEPLLTRPLERDLVAAAGCGSLSSTSCTPSVGTPPQSAARKSTCGASRPRCAAAATRWRAASTRRPRRCCATDWRSGAAVRSRISQASPSRQRRYATSMSCAWRPGRRASRRSWRSAGIAP